MMKDEDQLGRKDRMLEGISGVINEVYSKIQQFQESEKSNEEEFIEIIRRAREEWQSAETTFNSVSDPGLVDFAIYNVEATKAKYIYLLKQAKELGIRTDFE